MLGFKLDHVDNRGLRHAQYKHDQKKTCSMYIIVRYCLFRNHYWSRLIFTVATIWKCPLHRQYLDWMQSQCKKTLSSLGSSGPFKHIGAACFEDRQTCTSKIFISGKLASFYAKWYENIHVGVYSAICSQNMEKLNKILSILWYMLYFMCTLLGKSF